MVESTLTTNRLKMIKCIAVLNGKDILFKYDKYKELVELDKRKAFKEVFDDYFKLNSLKINQLSVTGILQLYNDYIKKYNEPIKVRLTDAKGRE